MHFSKKLKENDDSLGKAVGAGKAEGRGNIHGVVANGLPYVETVIIGQARGE